MASRQKRSAPSAGQLVFAGFDGASPPEPLLRLVSAGRLGGVVLFSRNVESPEQLRELVVRLHDAAPRGSPLVVGVDQEGGRVQRLRDPWTEWPALRAVGELDRVEETRRFGEALARELADLGVDLDFAPCVDVDTHPDNPVIGDRSLGADAERVARHGAALVEALQGAGVAACAKHFPGHGDTTVDSHVALPRVPHGLERLRAVELVPFRAAVRAGVASVMTAHLLVPALDPDRPATLSPRVLELLRGELGFRGLLFSDDLEMGAVAGLGSPAELAEGAILAGVDAVLFCSRLEAAAEAVEALESLSEARVAPALARMARFKRGHAGGRHRRKRLPPYPEHRRLARRLGGTGPA